MSLMLEKTSQECCLLMRLPFVVQAFSSFIKLWIKFEESSSPESQQSIVVNYRNRLDFVEHNVDQSSTCLKQTLILIRKIILVIFYCFQMFSDLNEMFQLGIKKDLPALSSNNFLILRAD